MRPRDRIGERFGSWTVIGEGEYRGRSLHLLCRCDCGYEALVHTGNLYRGNTKKCVRCHGRDQPGRSRSHAIAAFNSEAMEYGNVLVPGDETRRAVIACGVCGRPIPSKLKALRRGMCGLCGIRDGRAVLCDKRGNIVTYEDLGRAWGVTKARAQQIVTKHGPPEGLQWRDK